MDVPIAANVLGTIGAICWSVQLIPQIIINHRRHHTIGLQPTMMLLWASAGVPLGVYNIVENFNIALRIQPQILTLLSLITWTQCCYYGRGWPVRRCVAVIAAMAALMGGIQCGLIFALRAAKRHEVEWPVTFMAVLSACLLCAGVLRHYWDIYQERTVRGISFIFVGIDAGGDLFSLVSVCFQARLDVLGMVIYGSELVLWTGVFICGGYYNLTPWVKQRFGRDESRVEEPGVEVSGAATGNDVALHPMPSSSSVFRTPSSVREGSGSSTIQDNEM